MSNRKITLGELDAPFQIKEVQVDGIQRWDKDNAYPTRMERIIDGSVTAKSSAGMMARFLVGEGFANESLNSIIVGKDRFGRDRMLYDVLRKIAKSISYYQGFYLRLQVDADLKYSGMRFTPIKHCRFGKMDSQEYSGKVVVYKNWDKQKGKFKRTEFVPVDVYNPNTEVIKAQIKAAKDITKYKGQMFFWFDDDEYLYPVSTIDPVHYDGDTEKQISMFENGELRRGFFLKYLFHHSGFTNTKDQDEFKEALKKMMGGGHEYSFMLLEGEFDEKGQLLDGPNIKVEEVKQNINARLFESYENSVINRIRKAFNAIPQILIDYEDGKLGTTSGEALTQASMFYNKMTVDYRKNISLSLQEIFKNWAGDKFAGEDFTIKELVL